MLEDREALIVYEVGMIHGMMYLFHVNDPCNMK